MSNHKDFYSFAEYYDIAFDFKNIAAECDFLSSCFSSIIGRQATSFLELAAGPALHSLELSRRGLRSVALDLSPEMVKYGLKKAELENIKLDYICADMIDFTIPSQFDLVSTLMDSTSYLLDNSSVISHLESVANHLNEGGLYILEMGHPRDIFNVGQSTENSWDMRRGDKKVGIQWGCKSDEFDPITQITQTSVTMKIEDQGETKKLKETAPQRCFTANEFKALVEASGKFEIVEMFGAMDRSIMFDNDKKSWRMIPVLQKL